jgi:hypothetical protein
MRFSDCIAYGCGAQRPLRRGIAGGLDCTNTCQHLDRRGRLERTHGCNKPQRAWQQLKQQRLRITWQLAAGAIG